MNGVAIAGSNMYRNGQSSVGSTPATNGAITSASGGTPRPPDRPGPLARHRADLPAVVEVRHDRRPAEGVGEHPAQPVDEPGLAVEVVEDEDAARLQVGLDVRERLFRVQERLEADVAGRREQRQRVGQGQDHEVVVLVGLAQERPPVVDRRRHPRILVGPEHVLVAADPVDRGIDLDGVDVAVAALDRRGDVVAGPGADDQHVVEAVAREPLAHLRVEPAERTLGRREALVRDAVGGHEHLVGQLGQRQALVGRPQVGGRRREHQAGEQRRSPRRTTTRSCRDPARAG